MSTKGQQSPSELSDTWIQENNELVNKWQLQNRDQNHTRLLLSEFCKLIRKIQGLPPLEDHCQLELSVVYNVCLLFIVLSEVSEAQTLLTQTMDRVLKLTGSDPVAFHSPVFWRTVLQSVESSETVKSCIQKLLCVQWAVWLANCSLQTIEGHQEEFSSLSTGVDQDMPSNLKETNSNIPLLVMEPRRFLELLQICTLITKGAEKLNEGQSAKAITDLQAASSLPAPRILVAYTHLLSGSCLARSGRPQMALQCYRTALETDSQCVCALYQSVLLFRRLGNAEAEIQALRLLHSTLMLSDKPVMSCDHVVSPSLLLRSQTLSSLLSVPSAFCVLHSLAQKCVLQSKVSEGVEHYLDLLAALHSEQHGVCPEESHLPRLPELYLEAGAALLMAQRPLDCLTLCDEVITTTLDLLPEKVVLEDGEAADVCPGGDDKVAMLLWTGAAYLLQGHSHCHQQDWKHAVIHYTRCINLLVKVHFREKGGRPQVPSADMVNEQRADLGVLQRLKGISLAWRGISFMQSDEPRNALRDLQLGLQAFPECVGAGLWCGEVLWKLGRRKEAASCWEKTWSITRHTPADSIPVYLREPQTGPTLDSAALRLRISELDLT
ncbi:Fanconi anemia group G protein isoform X1 [Nerophis lumbriciformis]|uniref:Fanconi anemia group G protein isoform X1 n=1 Tax=Nerophis lumbriciformis TaxID=546530 RepID=UPI002AE05C7E|nr:Fanconi anemia group G protein isoform X1 [Nerophis lumbriciformis]